jgi:hypothetical protein
LLFLARNKKKELKIKRQKKNILTGIIIKAAHLYCLCYDSKRDREIRKRTERIFRLKRVKKLCFISRVMNFMLYSMLQ